MPVIVKLSMLILQLVDVVDPVLVPSQNVKLDLKGATFQNLIALDLGLVQIGCDLPQALEQGRSSVFLRSLERLKDRKSVV